MPQASGCLARVETWFLSCLSSLEDNCSCWCVCIDHAVRISEPLYVIGAMTLIFLDAYVFFTIVLQEIMHATGLGPVIAHVFWALWLLFNVVYNHMKCVFTSPGCTAEVDSRVLEQAMTHDWRWCRKCNRGKPPLTHHCSICNRCVFRMDHHCPWMANCIGFGNYRYFFLFLWWMWMGSGYSALVMMIHLPWLFSLGSPQWASLQYGLLPFFLAILSAALFIGLSLLMGWHVWLVLTGQGTIDSMDNSAKSQIAKQQGLKWVNPYHLGPINNWKETFDVQGEKLWWIVWMLPRGLRKKGVGWSPPTASRTLREGECWSLPDSEATLCLVSSIGGGFGSNRAAGGGIGGSGANEGYDPYALRAGHLEQYAAHAEHWGMAPLAVHGHGQHAQRADESHTQHAGSSASAVVCAAQYTASGYGIQTSEYGHTLLPGGVGIGITVAAAGGGSSIASSSSNRLSQLPSQTAQLRPGHAPSTL